MRITAQELCDLLNGQLEGDPNVLVWKPAKIEEGTEGSVSFIANAKYAPFVYTTKASVLLVGYEFEVKQPVAPTLIRVKDVYSCVSILLEHFNHTTSQEETSSLAFVHTQTHIHPTAQIGAFAVISKGCTIGAHTIVSPHAYIGENVVLGEQVMIYPGVKIMHNCTVGNHTIIHANAVIGSDGFGFAKQTDGTYKKVPQVGTVHIGNQVEIGANTVIDRATMGATLVKNGVKLDNLIQVAHNVEIDEHTVIAAQTGISGSTKIGKNCMIGGQVGIVGHISIADGTKIQAQSGLAKSVKQPNTAWHGSPAFDYGGFMRSQVVFKNLPDLVQRIQTLEKIIEKMQEGERKTLT